VQINGTLHGASSPKRAIIHWVDDEWFIEVVATIIWNGWSTFKYAKKVEKKFLTDVNSLVTWCFLKKWVNKWVNKFINNEHVGAL